MRWALSLVLLGFVAVVVGAGTFAYFSDTEESTGNYIAAGTLNLVVAGEDPLTSNYNYPTDIYPGWSDYAVVDVKNDGSIDGVLKMDISYTDGPGETTEPEPTPDNGELSQYLYVVLYYSDDTTFDASEIVWEGYVSDWPGETELGNLPAGETYYIKAELSVSENVGNDIQGDSLTVDITFTLEQK